MPGFTTPDPLAETHTWESPYAYCGGDPVNRMDPTGLEWNTNDDGQYTFITVSEGFTQSEALTY